MDIRKIRVRGAGGDYALPSKDDIDAIAGNIRGNLAVAGVDCRVDAPNSTSIKLSGCRLDRAYMKTYGYNISPYTGHRGSVLGWEDWKEVGTAVNAALDNRRAEANVTTLGGVYVVRSGKAKNVKIPVRNVGSVINPVSSTDAWQSEGRGRDGWREDNPHPYNKEARELSEFREFSRRAKQGEK